MVEILFGQSYFLRFDPKLWEAMQPFPPLGSLYAASYLRSRGYQVAMFDAMLAESEAGWGEALDFHKPGIAVLFEDNFNYLSKMCLLRMREAAYTMIGMARQRGCAVVVCGADATDHINEYLQQGADYILIGEGEHTLGELMDNIYKKSSTRLEDIQGLAWGNGVRTPRRPDIRDLDALPFPAWDLVDVGMYRQAWLSKHGFFAMNMVSTRGCPFHCNWCAKPIWGQRYNVRSPQNVFAELDWLKQTYHPDVIWFVDDIFGLKPGWVGQFTELVEASGGCVPFKCLSRVDLLLRTGEVESLRRAGAYLVWVGAESGSQKTLDAMEKGTQVEQIYKASALLHEAGIQVGFFLQFGYPGENLADIQKTFQMVRDCQPDDIGISVSYPLPGTRFHAAVEQQLGARKNWYDSNDLAMLYQSPFSTAYYRQLHAVLHDEFRARRAWQGVWVEPRVNSKSGRAAGAAGVNTPPEPRGMLLVKWLAYNLRLPVRRWKLKRLARKPYQSLQVLPRQLEPWEAAKPSPQAGIE